jgi:hypothetical protein
MVGRTGAKADVGVQVPRRSGLRRRALHRLLAPIHALRPAGGARCVQHLGTAHRIGDVVRFERCDGAVVVREAIGLAVDDQLDAHAGRLTERVTAGVQRAVVDHRLGFAVVDHIAHFFGCQMKVTRREAQPVRSAARYASDECRPVFQYDRNRVAGLQTMVAKQPGQLVDPRIELRERALAVRRRDGHAIGMPCRYVRDDHAVLQRCVDVVDPAPRPIALRRSVSHVCSRFPTHLYFHHNYSPPRLLQVDLPAAPSGAHQQAPSRR